MADVLIAEYHAPGGDVITMENELSIYFPHKYVIKQSDIFNPDLYFELLQATPTGLLNHMPQYKEKDKNALMFTYPVLMAHDIADYDIVIVGEDQRPHIEFARDILHKVGKKCPKAIYEGGKIMDLRHPEQKMSKSMPESCLFLGDSDEVMAHKIKKAVTDEKGLANLRFIYKALSGEKASPDMANSVLKDAIIALLKGVTYSSALLAARVLRSQNV